MPRRLCSNREGGCSELRALRALCVSTISLRKKTMNIKSVFASKTIWGILLAAAPTVAQLFGYQLSAQFSEHASALIDQLVQLGGLVFAAYGRIVATKQLVVKAPKAE